MIIVFATVDIRCFGKKNKIPWRARVRKRPECVWCPKELLGVDVKVTESPLS